MANIIQLNDSMVTLDIKNGFSHIPHTCRLPNILWFSMARSLLCLAQNIARISRGKSMSSYHLMNINNLRAMVVSSGADFTKGLSPDLDLN